MLNLIGLMMFILGGVAVVREEFKIGGNWMVKKPVGTIVGVILIAGAVTTLAKDYSNLTYLLLVIGLVVGALGVRKVEGGKEEKVDETVSVSTPKEVVVETAVDPALAERRRQAGMEQILALAQPSTTHSIETIIGTWRIVDGIIGDIGITVTISQDGSCQFSNGVAGRWEIEKDNLLIKAQPFALFHLTPRGQQITGGWIEIAGQKGTMSSVILKKV